MARHPRPSSQTPSSPPDPRPSALGPETDRPPILVSACLAGLRTRHDGRSKPDPHVMELVRRGEAIPVCPEQLGGLPTPRDEASYADDAHRCVLTRSGRDVTRQFERGAEEVARLAAAVGARQAILKERSPSCGTHRVYQRQPDGKDKLVSGEGVTARRLRQMGLELRSEEKGGREARQDD